MSGRRKRAGRRGQSLVEVALLLPIILLVTLGGADLAQAYRFSSDVSGAARAGMRIGIQGDTQDIGDAIRSEPNSVVTNTSTVWGNTGPGGTYASCTNGTTNCGDPNGCPTSVFTGGRLACFAIHSCTLNSSQQCSGTYSSWGQRPEPNQTYGAALEVVVVYKFTPATPLVANLAGSGGSFYLTAKSQGLELYY